MERCVKIVSGFKPLTIFAKPSIFDVWQVSEYATGDEVHVFYMQHFYGLLKQHQAKISSFIQTKTLRNAKNLEK